MLASNRPRLIKKLSTAYIDLLKYRSIEIITAKNHKWTLRKNRYFKRKYNWLNAKIIYNKKRTIHVWVVKEFLFVQIALSMESMLVTKFLQLKTLFKVRRNNLKKICKTYGQSRKRLKKVQKRVFKSWKWKKEKWKG